MAAMKRLCGLLLFAAGLSAQSTTRLETDLAALSNPNAPLAAIATRVTDDILMLAEKDSQPSRQTTLDFAVELCKALASQPAPPAKLRAVSSAILDVLQSSGTGSYRFHSAVDRFRSGLIALREPPSQAKAAADRLLILGQEVRGPDDYRSVHPDRLLITR